jgi:hypothetical protein
MTCIVGVSDSGRVWIGGDSAGVAGYSIDVRADTKVFRNGAYLMGFTTSFRMGQLLHHVFKPPKPTTRNLERFMVRDFIPAVMECLDAGGWLSTENGRREGGTFLVGVHGELFDVDSDFQVGHSHNGYSSVGCGFDLALGSLHSTKGRPPRVRVKAALEAAAHHSAGVTGPFVIKTA